MNSLAPFTYPASNDLIVCHLAAAVGRAFFPASEGHQGLHPAHGGGRTGTAIASRLGRLLTHTQHDRTTRLNRLPSQRSVSCKISTHMCEGVDGMCPRCICLSQLLLDKSIDSHSCDLDKRQCAALVSTIVTPWSPARTMQGGVSGRAQRSR